MSDCIPDNEDERIQECYQVLLPSEWFQVTALEREESTQQGTLSKYDFYKQVKEVNQVDRELEWIKKRCVEWLKRWCNIVLKKAVVQNSILYKDHYLWVLESMITEFLQLIHDESPSGHQGQN